MSWAVRIRRGEGPFWGRLKSAAKRILRFHLPVNKLTRPGFRLLYHAHVAAQELLSWACRFFWAEPLFRSQCAHVGYRFQMEQMPYLKGCGRIEIGDGVRLSGKSSIEFSTRVDQKPELVIGNRTFVGHGCGLHLGKSIRIGSDCLLASGVRVYDLDGHPLDADRRRNGEPTPMEEIRPVVIEDDVWIGTCAIILKGVTIGSRSVIAAVAVVSRDVPADSVVAGNPARVVKQLVAKCSASEDSEPANISG
jgi:serine acetyltransferase